MSHIIATILAIATPVPRVSVQLEHMGAAVGTLVMPREAWEQVWIPMLATQRATIHEHVPNPVMP